MNSKQPIDIRDILCEMGCEESVVFDNPDFDSAIIGITEDDRIVYDFDKMVECLVERDEMDALEAVEFIEYNTIRALPYAGALAPVVMYPICKEDAE